MGSSGRDNYVCLDCGATHHHKGKCDLCGGSLKADRLMTEDDYDRLFEKMQKDEGMERDDKGIKAIR